MDIKDRVIKIIAEQAVLEPSDVTMDSTLEDLGIDSLGLVESIFAIERQGIPEMMRNTAELAVLLAEFEPASDLLAHRATRNARPSAGPA